MNKINVSLLKNYKTSFSNEKVKFNSHTYSTFNSSYIKRCSDSYVVRMRNKLQTLYNKVKTGYNNIDSWWTDYNKDIENLERVLSDNGSSGSIKQSSVRNYVNANLHKLDDYRVSFADVISLNFVSSTPNMTFQSSSLNSLTSPNSNFNNVVGHYNADNSEKSKSKSEDKSVLESVWSDITEWWDDNVVETIDDVSEWWADTEEAIKATAATAATGFAEGFAKAGEWLLDGMAMLGNAMSAQNMSNAWAFSGSQLQIYQDTVKFNNEATKAFVETDYVTPIADKYYEETASGRWQKENAFYFNETREIGKGLGQTTGTLVFSIGGSPVATAAVIGMGKGSEQAYQSGADYYEGAATGLATGLWEGMQWHIGMKINKWNPIKGDSSGVKVLNSLIRVGADSIDGGVEGFAQPLINSIYQDGTYSELFEASGGWTNVGVQTAIGSVGSLIGEVFDLGKYFRNEAKLGKLPAMIDVSSGKTFSTHELLGIIQDEDNLAKFLNFDNNKTMFNGTQKEYAQGIKQLLDTTDKNKIDLGISTKQRNILDKFIDNTISNPKNILDDIMSIMGDSAGRKNLLLYASNGNVERIPVEFRDKIKNITTADIKNYFGIEDTKIGAQFFGEKTLKDTIDSVTANRKNPLITEFKRGNDVMGGNQGSILDKFKKLFKSASDKAELANLEATARKFYPDITKQELTALYTKIRDTGCTYVATANSIFEQLNYDAALFKQKFGFDMYLPNGELNHDQLILHIYASLDTMTNIKYTTSTSVNYSSRSEAVKQIFGIDPNTLANPHNFSIESLCAVELDKWRINNKVKTSIQSNPDGSITIKTINPQSDIIGTPNDIAKELLGTDLNIKTEAELLNILKSNGIVINSVHSGGPGSKLYNNVVGSDKWLNAYFEKNGIELKANISYIHNKTFVKDDVFDSDALINTLVKEYENGASITVNAIGGNPIDITDGTKLGHQMLGEGKEGHAMIFRGVTPEGNVIVSSWGKYFLLEEEFLSSVNFNITNIKDSAVKNITDANIKSNVGIEDAKISSQFVENANTIKKYSPYSTEQLMKDKNYQDACNHLLELVTDEKTKAKLEDILYLGGHGDFSISSNKVNVDNSFIEAQRRLSIAQLLITNPETFDILAENNINLFHGTNANALPNILKYGLNSGAESEKLEISVLTGEASTRMNGNQRDFVSFTDVLDIAEDYSGISSELVDNDLSFNVIIGTTIDEVQKAGTYTIHSDTPELGVKTKLPVESIKLIGVPTDKVDFVKKMVVDDKIKVVAIDNFDNRFYYADYDSELLEIYPEYFKQLKESLNVSIDATSRNSILDGIVEKMGDSAGRKNLLLYAANGNIDRIPVEFREAIKDVSPSEIKNYLGVEDTKIGAQFFGEGSDNISIKNFDAEEFITTFCNEFKLDYSTSDRAIVDALVNAIKNNDTPNNNVKLMLENFGLIKKINPDFSIATWSGNSMYWTGTNQLVMNSNLLANGAEGTSMTLLHEIGHVFLNTVKGDSANMWRLEHNENISQILNRAKDYVKNNPKLDNILQFSNDGINNAFKETVDWYDGIRTSEAKRITDLVSDSFESRETDKLVSLTKSALNLPQVQEILKEAGISGSDIDSILSNKELLTQILITNNAIAKQVNYNQLLTEQYSKYGVHRKLQSMLNSLLQSSDSIEMQNGKIFNFTFAHDKSYWDLKGEPDMSSYNELFADFFSLQAHGQVEALEMFKEMVGEELYNQLDQECDEIAEILLKYAIEEGN